ncbi:hypothetical protein F511_47768 [Dorcoceras hygrometricum]|uniref:Uncharacterized protein n=1 Tax=Dorcoceras hygrometricum TaxID=472368 RepID=A0A2Z6ZQA6_9LAMI|nr:hypothetical protein F511_47768 [Dorcoceras hygrometricum]
MGGASSLAGRTIAHMLAHVSDDGRAMAPLVCATRCGDWWPDAVDVRRWLRVTAACWPARRRAALRRSGESPAMS